MFLIIGLVLVVLVSGIFFYPNLKTEDKIEEPEDFIQLRDIQNGAKISFETGILDLSSAPMCEGDFKVTFNENEDYPGIAGISSSWLGNGVPPYGGTCSNGALTQKIMNIDFEDITIKSCENLDYERPGTIVSEGETVCWKSENGTYAIIKLVKYYGNFTGQIKYKILE